MQIDRFDLQADVTGTLELVCERTEGEEPVEVRTFTGRDEFGLLADDLEPNEAVALFVERGNVAE
ncbi:hypothetical protein OB905_06525 [Halobacteria archaeon AArc-dxtr1]|nr:hypothetical protein [Halobacteria archaeon AArc-dxtr1]